MKIKILLAIFIPGLLLSMPFAAQGAEYNRCCVCQTITQYGTGGTVNYFLPSGSTADNLITDQAVCDEKDSLAVTCLIHNHELCGEVKIETSPLSEVKFGKIILGITIPNLRFSAPPTEVDEEGNIYIPWIGEYIKAIYNFSMIMISIIAVVVIIMQGLRITASAGGPAKSDAAQKIGQAVVGLLIAWGSYVILFAVNPNLTEFKSLDIRFIDKIPSIDLLEDEPLTTVPDKFINNIPDFKQFDKRWGSEMFGSLSRVCDCGTKSDPGADRKECSKQSNICCTSIKAAGCAPTSLAMVLASYGANVTPLETAEFIGLKGNGRICNKGTNFNAVVGALPESPWSDFMGKEVAQNEAYELLKKGQPIIFLCSSCTGKSKTGDKSYNGHYMVLTGLAKGGTVDEEYTVSVNDPGGNANSGIITMSKTQLLNNNGFWYVYKNE